MNPVTSLWYGVDMLAEKYTASGSYVCCIENPVKFIDINGNEWGEKTNEKGENVDLSFVGHSLGGGLAAVASMATGHNAMTFNPAAVVSPYLKGDPSKITNYIAKSRPIFLGFSTKDTPYGYTIDGIKTFTIGGDCVTAGQALIGIKAPGRSVNVYTSFFAGHGIDNFYDYYYKNKK